MILALSEELIFISRKVTIWWQFFGRGSYGTATNNGGETKRLWDGSRRRKEGDVWSGTCQSAKLSVSVICHTNNSSASGPYTTSPPLLPILPLQLPPSSLFLLPIPIILSPIDFIQDSDESRFEENRNLWSVSMKSIPVWGVSENGGRCVSFETAPPSCKKLQQWSTQLTRVIVRTLCNSQNTHTGFVGMNNSRGRGIWKKTWMS